MLCRFALEWLSNSKLRKKLIKKELVRKTTQKRVLHGVGFRLNFKFMIRELLN